jgi:hypothetical protein
VFLAVMVVMVMMSIVVVRLVVSYSDDNLC